MGNPTILCVLTLLLKFDMVTANMSVSEAISMKFGIADYGLLKVMVYIAKARLETANSIAQ